LLVARVLELPRAAEVGIVLMAIAPGAPVALRRSLSAGGHQAFAPSLQISAALLAPVSMPLSVAALEQIYAARAVVGPGEIARQVFFAQLLPLALGMTLRRASAVRAERLDASVKRLGLALLAATVGTVLIDTWEIIADAGLSVLAAMALTAAATLAAGHLLGGPEPAMRTAVAVAAAARNGGLALLVTAVNRAPPEVIAAVLAYLVVSVFTIVPYVAWRRWRANVSG
jgi:BASS family bile acid:Na+ symporter